MKVFSGKRLDVEVNRIKLPNGNVLNKEMVHSGEAVAILPLLDKNTIIMLKQFRPVIKRWQYEFPAGLIDRGETPVEAAKRELKEETGFTCGKIRKLTSVFSSPGFSDELIHLFVASDLKSGAQELEPSENLRVLKMPLEKAKKMARSGVIKDAHSVLALFMFASLAA